jgi:hypothetical protein
MVQDWDIKPRQACCHACATPFDDNQRCTSALAFGQEGYARADYCEKCWNEKGNSIQTFSVWSGIFKKPLPPAEDPLKKEDAEELLRRLMTNEDPAKINVIYILALILERKRILVEKDIRTRDDGILIRVYEHKKTGETFLVPDPKLGFHQLAQVQTEVAEMLGIPQKPESGTRTNEGLEGKDNDKSVAKDEQGKIQSNEETEDANMQDDNEDEDLLEDDKDDDEDEFEDDEDEDDAESEDEDD